MGIRNSDAIEEAQNQRSGERIGSQRLTTDNGSNLLINEEAGIQLTLPSTWTEDLRLHDTAELQASDAQRRLYVVVVAEDKGPLRREGTDENAANYRSLLISKLQTFDDATPTDVAFIGEDFARQFEIRGRVTDETPVVYLHTTVDTLERYYQIVAWTTPEQYPLYKSELQTIADSFQEEDS